MTPIREPVRIEIWTPYLWENVAEKYDADYIQAQIELYGYDPQNLLTEDKIVTGRNIVLFEKEMGRSLERPHLILAGCTENQEDAVKRNKGRGLLVARYSTFYGEPSVYTGNYPDDSGYALDIPKKPAVVKALLQQDDFLEAILARDEVQIRGTLDRFNATAEKPVLVTDYLSEALRSE